MDRSRAREEVQGLLPLRRWFSRCSAIGGANCGRSALEADTPAAVSSPVGQIAHQVAQYYFEKFVALSGPATWLTQKVIMTVMVVVSLMFSAHAQVEAFECGAGQEVAAAQLSAAQGKALLERVQRQYASLEFMHGTFRQDSFVAALEQSESSAGEVWFGKPGKMRWVYTTPQPQTVIIKGKELWLYQPDKQQVLVDNIEQVLLSALPVSFMMGVGSLSKDFEYRGACRTRDGVVLRLQPRESGKKSGASEGLEGFLLLVDERTNLPKGAKITSLGGNVTAIVFSNVSTQGALFSSSTFVLEYPNGVDVVDRRIQREP